MARKAPSGAPSRRKTASAAPVKPARRPSGHAVPKPLKQLSPKYAARIKAAAKREGITVAQLRKRGSGAARGHAPPPGKTEATLRRERASARVEAFAMRQAMRWQGVDADQMAADIVAGLAPLIRAQGMDYLRKLEAHIADLNQQYMAQTDRDKRGRRPSLGVNLDDLSEEYDDLPPETFGYH
jgi:hypothetical protein